jgi:phospholipid/cholesterol/gamma-HCH transport system permease protein
MTSPTGDAGTAARARLVGAVTLANLKAQRTFLDEQSGVQVLDLTGVTDLDTAGAWVVVSFQATQKARGQVVVIDNASEAQVLLLQTVTEAMPPTRKSRRRLPHHEAGDMLLELGKSVSVFAAGLGQTIGFLGLVLTRVATAVLHPSRLRVTALAHHMQEAGLNAVPIVALMGFLIGVVLAFQGASQLEQFGAEIYVVDLIAISILRELGMLLTSSPGVRPRPSRRPSAR